MYIYMYSYTFIYIYTYAYMFKRACVCIHLCIEYCCKRIERGLTHSLHKCAYLFTCIEYKYTNI